MAEGMTDNPQDPLVQDFMEDARDVFAVLDNDLLSLEEDFENPPEAVINDVFRAVHTLKGNASFLGLSKIMTLAHSMENVFGAVRDKELALNSQIVDQLFKGGDFLRRMCEDLEGDEEFDISTFIDYFNSVLVGEAEVVKLSKNPREPSLKKKKGKKARARETLNTPTGTLVEEFRTCENFMRQIQIIEELEKEPLEDVLAPMLDLFAWPPDPALFPFLRDALEKCLDGKKAATLNCLDHTEDKVRDFGLYLVRKQRIGEAVSVVRKMLLDEATDEVRREGLLVFCEIKTKESEEALKDYTLDEDPFIAARAVAGLLHMPFDSAIEYLMDDFSKLHEIPALEVVKGLVSCDHPRIPSFLVGEIHNENPHIRRYILDALSAMGERVSQDIRSKFPTRDVDEQIMLLNVAGRIGSDQFLPYAIALTRSTHTNVRFAAYETLIRIAPLQSVYTTIKGLTDPDLSVRMMVLSGFEQHASKHLVANLQRSLAENDDVQERVIEAFANQAAPALLCALYDEYEVQVQILEGIFQAGHADIIEQYRLGFQEREEEELLSLMLDLEKRYPITDKGPKTMTVLAVDDASMVLKHYKNIFDSLGFKAVLALDGAQGLSMARMETFDLIFTDLNMPIMDGIEMVSQLRMNSANLKTPVIMVTTESGEIQEAKALEVGVNGFIQKPFTVDVIRTLVNKYLA